MIDSNHDQSASMERTLLQNLLKDDLKERKRARRWSIFFKSLFTIYVIGLTAVFWLDGASKPVGEHTALVNMEGTIASGLDIDADLMAKGLRDAFQAEDSKAVIIRINSPGGSPVQAGQINDEIVRLKNQYPEKPVYAVITDICASGGYYIAVAADRIFADKASIVGSIGVLINGFGAVEAMEKLGIERRLITAGENKAMFDPFSPVKPEEQLHLQNLIDEVHQQFIGVVKAGRGDRLSDDDSIFSGLFWNGEEAMRLGLIDELGSAGYVARDVVGAEDIVDYTPEPDFLSEFTEQLGAAMVKSLRMTWLY